MKNLPRPHGGRSPHWGGRGVLKIKDLRHFLLESDMLRLGPHVACAPRDDE